MHKDPQMEALKAISGETGIELQPGERLVDIDVVSTQQTRYVPVPAENSKQPNMVPVKLVVFRATLGRMVQGELPDDMTPDVPDKNSVILPPGHKNRAERRKNNS